MRAASERASAGLVWLHGAGEDLVGHPLPTKRNMVAHRCCLQLRRRLIGRLAPMCLWCRMPCLHLLLCEFHLPPQGRGSGGWHRC